MGNTSIFGILPKEEFLNYTFETMNIIRQHKDVVMSIILLKDGRIASASIDKTIKIYEKYTYQCIMSMQGHKRGIECIIQVNNGQIVSCSNDKTIRVWSISLTNYKCLDTYEGAHKSPINKVIELSNGKIASCSFDLMIKVWSLSPKIVELMELAGNTTFVNSIIYVTCCGLNSIVSGSCNEILVFSPISPQCQTKIVDNISCQFNNSLLVVDNTLIVGGENQITFIKLPKYIKTGSYAVDNVSNFNALLLLDNGSILAGCERGVLYNFCLKSERGKIVVDKLDQENERGGHQEEICDLIKIGYNTFASCSWDSTIRIWRYYNPDRAITGKID